MQVEFRVQDNPLRKWYHAPWLHDDGDTNGGGREYHHGLTRERDLGYRSSIVFKQIPAQNWAIGFYNNRGGYMLGKVWITPSGYPDPSQASLPENTVAFKLLFTDAFPQEVPFLAGSLEWTANIYSSTSYQPPRVDRFVSCR